MFERIQYISILIGFFILSGIGVYFGNDENILWTEWITEKGRWVLILANLLFLFLAIRQMSVWNVYPSHDQILLKRFLGLKKMVLRKQDFTSFAIKMDKDLWWMKNVRTTYVLNLQTTQGKLTFNSSDYKSFDRTLLALFTLNTKMHRECLRQISQSKTKAGI